MCNCMPSNMNALLDYLTALLEYIDFCDKE